MLVHKLGATNWRVFAKERLLNDVPLRLAPVYLPTKQQLVLACALLIVLHFPLADPFTQQQPP
jgi:hypothetical protein